jgi:hypothetical protein
VSAAAESHELMYASSDAYRLQHSNVMIDGTVALDFNRYPFIPQIIDEHAPRITALKGAQLGLTVACIMRALEDAKRLNLRGIGYFFPTESEVSDFAKARFGPMMTNNMEVFGAYVKDTDSASLKRINQTFLYFRGVGQRGGASSQTGIKRSTSKLKSIPLDHLYLDERDEMDDDRVDAVEYRLDGSLAPEIFVLSTPTLPGYGVDYDYKHSNQSVWMWQCARCNDWTCLELSYPDCIAEPINKDPYYLCDGCGKRIERERGQWVAREQGITDHIGYWVSQLSSPTKTAASIVIAAQEAVEKGRHSEFQNQTLARAHAEVDQEITKQQLEDLIDVEATKPLRHEGPCAMGVDPGKPHWYEVRVRITEKDSEVIAMGKADTYEELGKVAKQFNVESGVMDQGYDPSAVAKFCEDHPGWYGCLYVGKKVGEADWDHKKRMVKAGRTRVLDSAHATIVNKRVRYYQKSEFWNKHFVPQMTQLKRATIEDGVGTRSGVWVVTGGQKNDHLRHADAYCDLALERCGISHAVRRMKATAGGSKRKKRNGMTL